MSKANRTEQINRGLSLLADPDACARARRCVEGQGPSGAVGDTLVKLAAAASERSRAKQRERVASVIGECVAILNRKRVSAPTPFRLPWET